MSDGEEFLTCEDEKRYVIFPIRHQDMWDMYKKAQAMDWRAEEIDFSQDSNDWEHKINDNEKYSFPKLSWLSSLRSSVSGVLLIILLFSVPLIRL